MAYKPTLVIAFGQPFAEKLCQRTETLIKNRFKTEICPPLFQFVSFNQNAGDYSKELLKLRSLDLLPEIQKTLGNDIEQNVDIVFITPFKKDDFDRCLNTAKTLRQKITSIGLKSTFTAIFLIAKDLFDLDENLLTDNAETLEQEMSSNDIVFNRCFFIDQINESVFTFDKLDDLIELLAIYLDLALASPMNVELERRLPLFFGNDDLKNAYASLSCSAFTVSPQSINSVFNEELSKTIWCDIHQPLADSEKVISKVDLLKWQKSFLEKSISENQYITGNDLDSYEEFHELKSEIVRLLALEFQNRKYNPDSFCAFLDSSLEKWLVNLENRSDLAKDKKVELSEKIINKTFPLRKPKPSVISEPEPPPSLWERIKRFFKRLWAIFTGLWTRKQLPSKKTVPQINASKQKEAEEKERENLIIKKLIGEYEEEIKRINILTDLFVFLDKIHINLELNREGFSTVLPEDYIKKSSIFHTDLSDSKILRQLFFKELHLEKVSSYTKDFLPNSIEEFFFELAKYPNGEIQKSWSKVCSRKQHFNLSRLEILRKVKEVLPRETLTVFKPFWNPIANSGNEKFTIVSWSDAGNDHLNELEDLFSLDGQIIRSRLGQSRKYQCLANRFRVGNWKNH